ncbi:bifunctional proline dehydrogenase/L-glutamate gamma-semialdehyde dehydrogenase PutA [Oceanibacterium hippocampi]|uniref:Bifunctional protein PutA n=1 Tax=Oceanibacterium hippocampi TaxID=745714 RepID=A0A1Y5R8W6_9PROT|nr:bifunctional proline dehydrogenase/L-glutamate gamma-semialdehyde dehydrogenase PutA [Oceanibacterium hippocampi]SLN11482.1 Bifunctional protein PutA [Oceanibacterium hippocampi]
MIFAAPPQEKGPPDFAPLRRAYRMDETAAVEALLAEWSLDARTGAAIEDRARKLVKAVRRGRRGTGGLDAFLHEYELSSREGIVLMCLAEALLRIPDAGTMDDLIRDKIGPANWESHLGQSSSAFVNASTWGLMFSGRLLGSGDVEPSGLRRSFRGLMRRGGEPFIREAMRQAMRIMGKQFVMGRDIGEAIERAEEWEARGYRYSYDMLGEAARTREDAARYFKAYEDAIEAIGSAARGATVMERAGISVKLSALDPRYEEAQRADCVARIVPQVRSLALAAKDHNIGLTIDAEEADRLELQLEILKHVYLDPALDGWDGLGLALQAYQKRAPHAVDWLAELARTGGRRIMVRLVKGAYWDSEIKRSQEAGFPGYPVFTRKASTDLSYLVCARALLARRDRFHCQFATHNAHSVAAILAFAGDDKGGFEFQRLHGMGVPLYEEIVPEGTLGIPCRVYAPVGRHEDLLAYLVRRLLENGANTSFVNRIVDDKAPIEEIIADPTARVAKLTRKPHPGIPLPVDLYGAERKNSTGIDFSDPSVTAALAPEMERFAKRGWKAAPSLAAGKRGGKAAEIRDPSDNRRVVGEVVEADAAIAGRAADAAAGAAPDWNAVGGAKRAAILERLADLLEGRRAELMALLVREAGKTLPDAISEVREAADFCRYYAAGARRDFVAPVALPGPTGERNEIALAGRGVFLCISPWNFPLAIFTGQVAAALAAGNAVLAKPAEQTPLIAARAVALAHEAGVPAEVLQLLPGPGPEIGNALLAHPALAGVAFTGSTETAKLINRRLADRPGAILPLIAETGGQNAMLVDSSALAEQVIPDVVSSAFGSAGQRCSALRVLFVQDDVADRLIRMLEGAMAELKVGDPGLLETDIGPVIDREALGILEAHARRIAESAREIGRVRLGADCGHGTFFAPRAFEIEGIGVLEREVFGPVLHVVRFEIERLDAVLDAINGTGYGLTLGVHTRIDERAEHICRRLRVGNAYVNRNMVGAVVGVQPFGGEGLSGTGPKAGGPHYLHRFATERTLSVNITATGGNAGLLSLEEQDL